jgi:hypothetical protein
MCLAASFNPTVAIAIPVNTQATTLTSTARIRSEPLEKGKFTFMGLLKRSIGRPQRGRAILALFKVLREPIERGPRGIIAEADAVLVVFLCEAVDQRRCAKGAVLESDHVHCDEVARETLQEDGVDAGFEGEGCGGEAFIAGFFEVLEQSGVDGHPDDG